MMVGEGCVVLIHLSLSLMIRAMHPLWPLAPVSRVPPPLTPCARFLSGPITQSGFQRPSIACTALLGMAGWPVDDCRPPRFDSYGRQVVLLDCLSTPILFLLLPGLLTLLQPSQGGQIGG